MAEKRDTKKREDAVQSLPSGVDLSISVLENAPKSISAEVVGIIPEEVAQKYKIAAFGQEGNVVKVAMVNPQNLDALNALRFVAEKKRIIIDAYSTSDAVFNNIMSFYAGPGEIIKKAVSSFENQAEENTKAAGKMEEKHTGVLKDAPVSKLVQVIISHAIDGRASDIHIEPMDRDYRVRFRVDGVLHVSLILPREIGPAVISRIKILANLKIDEKRKPQDGRFRLNNAGKDIDFRVSTFPVIEGEKVVMRILDKSSGLARIETLGLLGTALENVKAAMKETYGMILFTGPTGSGKSTSLYTLLTILNKEERNIVTLEDPIEYHIEGLNQSQMQPDIGYTFASGLRTILRQDPNVIMVGEIRDKETAELSVHAALTGHLMFSTLHTNTAIGAIPRLIDMGIEPFLLSSSLRLVAAQRLLRRICESCKEEQKLPESIYMRLEKMVREIPEEEIKKYNINSADRIKVYHGKGCDKCNGTGLKGRLAIYEIVPINDKIKDIIIEKGGSEELITKERVAAGLISIKQDAILKIVMGTTTIEEAERVTEGSITLIEEND